MFSVSAAPRTNPDHPIWKAGELQAHTHAIVGIKPKSGIAF